MPRAFLVNNKKKWAQMHMSEQKDTDKSEEQTDSSRTSSPNMDPVSNDIDNIRSESPNKTATDMRKPKLSPEPPKSTDFKPSDYSAFKRFEPLPFMYPPSAMGLLSKDTTKLLQSGHPGGIGAFFPPSSIQQHSHPSSLFSDISRLAMPSTAPTLSYHGNFLGPYPDSLGGFYPRLPLLTDKLPPPPAHSSRFNLEEEFKKHIFGTNPFLGASFGKTLDRDEQSDRKEDRSRTPPKSHRDPDSAMPARKSHEFEKRKRPLSPEGRSSGCSSPHTPDSRSRPGTDSPQRLSTSSLSPGSSNASAAEEVRSHVTHPLNIPKITSPNKVTSPQKSLPLQLSPSHSSLPSLTIPPYSLPPSASELSLARMSAFGAMASLPSPSFPFGINGNSGIIHPALLRLPGRKMNGDKPPPVKKYKCDICGKAFSRSNTLVTHKRIHTGEKPFKCEVCGRAFRQPGNLTRHRLTHTTVKPYVCPTCNKAFNRASNLHTHMRTHTNYKPFVCQFCGKGFHQKIDMKIHSYTHTGEKPHKCKVCGRGFKQLTHLTYHMRTHSEEKVYHCEICGKGFNQKGNLQAHIYGHTGERPHKCDICGKGFTLASTLNTHRRTHADNKPFVCQYCGKDFYQKNALKSHLIASHPYTGTPLL